MKSIRQVIRGLALAPTVSSAQDHETQASEGSCRAEFTKQRKEKTSYVEIQRKIRS